MNKLLSFLRNNYAAITKILLFVTAIVILVYLFPKEGKFKYEFSRGKPWMHDNLIATFDFPVLKSEQELKQEEQDILMDLKLYFKNSTEKNQALSNHLKEAFRNEWIKKYGNADKNKRMKTRSLEICCSIYDTILSQGIIEVIPDIADKQPSFKLIVITDNVAEEKALGDFLTIRQAHQKVQRMAGQFDGIDRQLVVDVLENSLVHNIIYDAVTTQKQKQILIDKISITRGLVQSGEIIISRGEIVSGEQYQILESLRKEYEIKLGSSFEYAGILTGQVILLSISMISLYLFLLFFRKEIFSENKKIVLLLILIVFMVFITSMVVRSAPWYVYLIPVCLIPIIVGVFSDTRMALFAHLITIIITGFLVPNSYEFVFLQLFAGIVTILSIVRLERRSQFFLTSLLIFITYSLIYTGMTLIKEGSLEEMNYFYFALFGGSAVLTLFAYPLIYLFEKIFGLITDVTLLELSNTNNKILRELALKAPGTFQHSMQMANLAEEAIYEIGGNPLLVRTGAMYHDIGKIDGPLYFVENQTTGLNPHDELTYEESAQIIIDHITMGVEKAKKFKLPEQIIDFIRTHHGTRKTDYFYTLAKRENPMEDVDEMVYTYHGPEPFSKETAVLMMADTVEAATRSLKNPDEESISLLVESVIDKQIAAHQFDNADITFRDIKKIKKIFKKKLMNIYHLRIEYPE